ncbi:MAG TPA: hypothetical protein VGX78_07490 [Pirellulales bacterium]|jgi:hypothetical protein|nr:hypothetical protein [Pirellulales bacterium]
MDLRTKVERSLRRAFKPSRLDLDDEDGISGYVVSEEFRGVEPFDRQTMIDKALRSAPGPLTARELRRVIAVAALTPEEYVAYSAG